MADLTTLMDLKDKDLKVFGNISAEEANKLLHKREKNLFVKRADGYHCKKCDAIVMQTTIYVSEHTTLFSNCAGPGNVQPINFPYCPVCEGEPKMLTACMHEDEVV